LKPSPSTDNRSLILTCALELFAARGYDSIGVQELVTAAGITKPTLYYYFGSKRGVLETLMKEQFLPFISQLAQTATYAGDLPLSLQRVVEIYFQFATQNPRLYQLHLSMWFAIPDNEASQTIRPVIESQLRILEELFLQAGQHHGNMRDKHSLYAATFLSMVNAYISKLSVSKWNNQTVWQLIQQFSYGIYT
jgi:TetR/AcrR family transcriptional regulator